MSEYLKPNNLLEISDQRKIFEIRNKMTNIPANFSSKSENETKCVCGKIENMEHIYNCISLNETETKVNYLRIFEGNINKIRSILKRFEQNMSIRNKQRNHVIQICDPSTSDIYEIGNG